jgi:hypothetical protein
MDTKLYRVTTAVGASATSSIQPWSTSKRASRS